MAKVRFCLNSGANIHSTKTSQWFDTVEDLGLAEGEWEELDEDERYELAESWANDYLEIYYEEEESEDEFEEEYEELDEDED